MSKQAIIDKILSDANDKAGQILASQQAKADEISRAADEDCKLWLKQEEDAASAMTRDSLERAKTVAELDAKKLLLGARAHIIDSVFERALEKLVALDDAAMKKLLLSLLKNADDGDSIVLNARGRELLKKDDIAEFAKKKKLTLSLDESVGDFAGGLILRGNGIDKNLTFEVELALIRDSAVAEIAKQIFD